MKDSPGFGTKFYGINGSTQCRLKKEDTNITLISHFHPHIFVPSLELIVNALINAQELM